MIWSSAFRRSEGRAAAVVRHGSQAASCKASDHILSMQQRRIILIYPPVARACEAPAGIARLGGALKQRGAAYALVDANYEALADLLASPGTDGDTWTRRSRRHLKAHLETLCGSGGFDNMDRYRRAVFDLNRLLYVAGRPKGVHLGLANYQDERLSPLRSRDLLEAAGSPERNPFFGYFSRRLRQLMRDDRPSWVGFSLVYLSQALTTFAMAGYLRRIRPDVRILLGGGLVTSWMRSPAWRGPFGDLFDVMVSGAGEAALLDILELPPGGRRSLPDYDDLRSNAYLSPGFILPYSASDGCYWNRCSFCPERAEQNPYRPLPAATAVDDLHRLAAQTKPVLIHLLDNALSPKLMAALAANPPGPPWYGFARITPHLADPDFCRSLKRSGCRMLQLGLESGDQRVLDSLCKGIDLQTAVAALEALGQAGIATYVYLLFGTAAENRGAAQKTLDFTVAHKDGIGFLNLAVFNLPAYGPEVRVLDTSRFYEGDLCLYRNFDHPQGWQRQRVRRFLDRDFKRHPAVAPIIRRDPPIFTSNHAAFFTGLKGP